MKKNYALCLAFFTILYVCASAFSLPTSAAGNCSALFNGGSTTRQFCLNPTILPTPAPFKENLSLPTPTALPKQNTPQQTRGGQKIYPAAKTKTTPSTGPEEWSLPALFLLGGMGFFLRKKATKLN